MAGYYDEITGDWISLGNDPGFDPLDNNSGTRDLSDTAIFDPGTGQYTDNFGYPVDSTGAPMPGNPNYLNPDLVGGPAATPANTETTIGKYLGLAGTELKNWISANPKLAASIGAAGAKALGLNDVKTGGWQGAIPALTAVRAQVKYDDTNREPGSTGRSYFTPTQYVAPGLAGAVRKDANKEAAAMAAAMPATKADPGVDPYAGKFAMPWAQKKAVTGNAPVSAGSPPAIAAPVAMGLPSLDKAIANLATKQGPRPADDYIVPKASSVPTESMFAQGGIAQGQGQYLQGATDGMADKLNTSIDDTQPAKLSHGEFVIPADVVSHLGNGNSEAGAKHLYAMMDRVREARTGTKKQGREIDPDKFTPGGLATHHNYAGGGAVAFDGGGNVPGFNGTTNSVVPAAPAASAGTTGLGTSTSSTLSPWAGNYVADMLGKGKAFAEKPYEAYKGPLTAGASDLQKQQQTGLSELAKTGLAPTQFSTNTFDATQANKFMNPYLQASLDPQLKELQRTAQINNAQDAARLMGAGAYGGGRQAVLMGEQNRNLLDKSGALLSQGYNTAYDKAMGQFNAEQNRGLQTEQAQDLANKNSADFGLKTLDALGTAGSTQRDITQTGLTADKKAFEDERDYDAKMVQYQQGLLQGLPITTNTSTPNTTTMSSAATGTSDMMALLKQLGLVK